MTEAYPDFVGQILALNPLTTEAANAYRELCTRKGEGDTVD